MLYLHTWVLAKDIMEVPRRTSEPAPLGGELGAVPIETTYVPGYVSEL